MSLDNNATMDAHPINIMRVSMYAPISCDVSKLEKGFIPICMDDDTDT
jgi:hypothetical protein